VGAAVAAMPGTLSVPIRHTSHLTGLPSQGRPWRFASTPDQNDIRMSHLQNSATQTPEFPTEDAPRSGTEVI
jgi:hypothetical protein